MLAGSAKVLKMPVASLVDAVTSFFEYFSFLYDFVVFWHGCISKITNSRYSCMFDKKYF